MRDIGGHGIDGGPLPGRRIGEFAYAVDTLVAPNQLGTSRVLDFGLIRLDRGVKASAQMCHWGGPTGLNLDLIPPPTPVTLRYYGNAIGISTATPARSAVATGTADPYQVIAWGASLFGDSGSPVVSADGRAIGVLNGGGIGVDAFTGQTGTTYITRFGPALARAQRALKIKLRIETAGLLAP